MGAAYVRSLRFGANPLHCQIVIAALVLSICAFAKDKDKENGSEVKFTSRTELVLIPTLVMDKTGAHISGLKKDDFTVLENGSERQIATFEEITSDHTVCCAERIRMSLATPLAVDHPRDA